MCCLRELKEETGIAATEPELLTVRGDPNRDPRGHTVTIVYKVIVAPDSKPKAGDDAASAEWYSLKEMLNRRNNVMKYQ